MLIHEELRELVVPIDSLVPYHNNAREGDVGAIVESLETNGQYKAITVNTGTKSCHEREILAGNHTWFAAKMLGATEIAARFIDVDAELAARIVLVDNRTNDLASYDELTLTDALSEILGDAGSLTGTGYHEEDLADMLARLEAPLAFDDVIPDELEESYVCPKCGYAWSGSAT